MLPSCTVAGTRVSFVRIMTSLLWYSLFHSPFPIPLTTGVEVHFGAMERVGLSGEPDGKAESVAGVPKHHEGSRWR